MIDRMIKNDLINRSESILSYYHIFSYAATSRKEYRHGKYEGYDFALLIFVVISCIEDLHINQRECTKKTILEEVGPALVELGVTDISPEDLVNEVITNCLENNGVIIKKDSFLDGNSPSINLINSRNMNRGGFYETTYDLTTSSLNMLYSTKEFFDIVSQSNIIIKKQLKRGNIGEAIREAKALRSTISVELDEVEKMIENIRNNIYNLDAIKVNERMQNLLDEIIDHQKETRMIIESIDKSEGTSEYLTQKDKSQIKGILNEVSKMQLQLLTSIQECIKLLDDNILNFDFITNHNTLNIYQDIITPIEKDKEGLIRLDRLFAPLFALPENKLFDLDMVFKPQQVVTDQILDVHYVEEVEEQEIEEQVSHTNQSVEECSTLFYMLLDELTECETLTMEEFIERTPYSIEVLSSTRLLALYLFTAKENNDQNDIKVNRIDGDYHTSIHMQGLERSSFSVLNEFFLYPKRTIFQDCYIEITPEEKQLEYRNESIQIKIPNIRFRKVRKIKQEESEGGTL